MSFTGGGPLGVVEVYEFKPGKMVALQWWELREALSRCSGNDSSFRLGWVVARIDCGSGEAWLEVPKMGLRARIDLSLKNVEDRSLLVFSERGFEGKAEFYSGAYYKLASVEAGMPPTLEINGIHMHRVVEGGPWRDAVRKASLAVKRGFRVLDVGTGLGYTAEASLRRGARLVYTIEVDENVLSMAAINPWSWGLLSPRVRVLKADAFDALDFFGDGVFDAVIHDPPRFMESTSTLYSLEFYKKLYRVLRKGGLLYHYTGEPGKSRRINLPGRVSSLLREAGFEVLGYRGRVLGVLAVKR
ncbi:MAG: methyltransferase domain-containing protein [Desulfurococcales archaeon]|nr:methyltransferase domain-containing protein [Desulfurococcales archaeon]